MRGAALALPIVLALTGAARADKVPLIRLTGAQEKALGLRLRRVEAAESRPLAHVPATFTPPANSRAAVVAPYPGVVTRVAVVEGQSVRRGQVLASMFSRDAITAAAELAQANVQTQVAAQAQRRTAELVREGIVAGARGEEATGRLHEAQAMAHAKALGVRAAGIDSTGHYTLKAPFEGRVAHVGVQAGQALGAGETGFIVDRTDRIQAMASLPASMAGKVAVGDRAVVDGAEGRVVSVGAQIDPKTRSLSLLAEVPPQSGFIPGRATSIDTFDKGTRGLLQAPRGALIRVSGRDVVFVRRPDGFVPTPVKVEGFAAGVMAFRADIKPGTPVAVSAVSELKNLAEK